MAILPLQLARVSNLLRTDVASRSITRTQQQLLEVQNQLSTGQRLTAPSDDPGDAAIIMQLQKTLEQRQAYSDNLKQATSHLGEVDSTLGDITSLLQQAQTLASANVGSDVTPDGRQAAAAVVKSLYDQMLTLANKQFNGVYVFAGDRSTDAPFVEEGGGIKFVGSKNVLKNTFDENTQLPFMVDGEAVFGALSTRIQGTADLTPRLRDDTRLVDLKGSTGEGVRPGIIQISNGTSAATVDLTQADTVGNVIAAIQAAMPGVSVSYGSGGTNLLISGGASDNLTISEVGGGTMAQDLGIVQSTAGGAGVAITGASAAPNVTLLTRLADLRSGGGIDQSSGITITNGLSSKTITFNACTTVEDMLNAINNSGTGVRAEINDAGTGINILNPSQGMAMRIAENGGTTASDLGVRSLGAATALSELNDGRGVRTVTGDDFQITLKNTTSFTVDLSGANTIGDVISKINAAAGISLASITSSGNGIRLSDPTLGPGELKVTPLNYSNAATDLGLDASANGSNILSGRDVNPVRAAGVFSNIAKLRDAMESNDQVGITAAAEGLKADYDRIVRMRGQAGARVQELESRQNHLEDENVATQSLLSSLADTNFTEAISRFQTLQTTLQATLQTSAKVMNMSLLDFLG